MDFEKIYKRITSICIFLVLLLGPLVVISNYPGTYYESLEYRAVDELEDPYSYMDEVVNFLFGTGELKSFEEDEANHMKDVKNLITIGLLIILFCCLIIFNYLLLSKDWSVFVKPSLGVLIIGFFIIIGVLLNFDFLFSYFHKIFFPMGNYAFPQDSLLITLFPPEFFYKKSIEIFLYTSILSVFTFLFGYYKRTS